MTRVLHGVAVRERACPSCAASIRERSARWCGSCGAPLAPHDDASPARAGGPSWRRRLLGATAGTTVIALLIFAGDGLIDRAAARSTAVADDAVDAPSDGALSRVERRPPIARPSTTEPTCVGSAELDCFAWTAELPLHQSMAMLVTREVLVSADPVDRTLTARRVADGAIIWTASAGAGSLSEGVVGTGDLVLHYAEQELSAWDLHTGEPRWSSPVATGVHVYATFETEGTLLVSGYEAGDHDLSSTAGVVLALDVESGEERWRQRGGNVSLAADGSIVLLDGTGTLQVLEPDGEVRWQLEIDGDLEDGLVGAYAVGHAVGVDQDGEQRLLTLNDGTDLGFTEAYDLVSDATHTLVSGRVEGVDGRDEHVLALLDADGATWRVPEWVASDVCESRLAVDAVELTACDGDLITLDRADGRERSQERGTAPASPTEEGLLDVMGPYAVIQSDPDTWSGDVVVTEIETGDEVARLPADSWPLAAQIGPTWTSELDGVVLLRSPGWLIALPLPDRDATVSVDAR